MNKKLILTVVAILVLLVGFVGIKTINNKNVEKGNKTITINVISNFDNLNEKEEIKTDEEKLGPVLSTIEGFKIDNGMVTMADNIDVSNSNDYFWSISINGEDALVGVNDQVIKDGDIITFEKTKINK